MPGTQALTGAPGADPKASTASKTSEKRKRVAKKGPSASRGPSQRAVTPTASPSSSWSLSPDEEGDKREKEDSPVIEVQPQPEQTPASYRGKEKKRPRPSAEGSTGGAGGQFRPTRAGKKPSAGPHGPPARRWDLPNGWDVYEDSSLDDGHVAAQFARFMNLPRDRRPIREESLEGYKESVLREGSKALARQAALMNSLEKRMDKTIAALEDAQAEVARLGGLNAASTKRINSLLGDLKRVGDRELELAGEVKTLQGEVAQLEAGKSLSEVELGKRDARILELEGKVKASEGEVQRLKDELARASRRAAEKFKSSPEQLRLLEEASARGVAEYKSSGAFKDDIAALYGGEVRKLLGIFVEELKIQAPTADPMKFGILKDFLAASSSVGTSTTGEGEAEKGKKVDAGGDGSSGKDDGKGPEGGEAEDEGKGPNGGEGGVAGPDGGEGGGAQ